MRIFQKKACKITAAPKGSAPEHPLASGGRGLRPQTPTLLLPLTDINSSKCVSSLKTILLLWKSNNKYRSNNQQMVCFCFFRAFALIFHFKLYKKSDKYLAPPEMNLAVHW